MNQLPNLLHEMQNALRVFPVVREQHAENSNYTGLVSEHQVDHVDCPLHAMCIILVESSHFR